MPNPNPNPSYAGLSLWRPFAVAGRYQFSSYSSSDSGHQNDQDIFSTRH